MGRTWKEMAKIGALGMNLLQAYAPLRDKRQKKGKKRWRENDIFDRTMTCQHCDPCVICREGEGWSCFFITYGTHPIITLPHVYDVLSSCQQDYQGLAFTCNCVAIYMQSKQCIFYSNVTPLWKCFYLNCCVVNHFCV